jgi:hypothetical protein
MWEWPLQVGSPLDRLLARVARAVRRSARPGRSFRVEAARRGPADGSILVSDASRSFPFVFGNVTGGRVSAGFRAELDAFLAGR